MGKGKAKASSTDLSVEARPIGSITAYANNPRRNELAITKVAKSLKAFGWRQPIVVNAKGVIIAGHTRFEAAKSLGMTDVPVHVAANLTPQQVRAYRLADNRVGQEAEWNDDKLVEELRALDAESLTVTGFDDQELARLLAGNPEACDPNTEWYGMPEFTHEDKTGFQSLAVHFPDQSAVERFAELVGQPITPTTRYLWFPPATIERMADKAYVSES